MDTHGVKRAAEPNAYEHLAKRVYRPSPTAARGEQEDTTKPNMEPGPSAAATTEFLTEVLGALYGDTTGHPENGSFSYFKAAENYALASADDGHSKSHVPPASYATVAAKAQPAPPGFERSAKALYERRQASSASSSTAKPSARTGSATATYKPQTKQQCLNAGGDGGSQRQHGNASMNDLSQMYLQLLQQSLPHQQLQQQQHNLSMYNNDIANVYAQLLAVNLRQNHQQQQQQQTTNTAAAAAILYEAMLQQRARALQQHQQLQQQQQQQQQQQARNTPRGIYGNNFASSSLSKTPTPENKPN